MVAIIIEESWLGYMFSLWCGILLALGMCIYLYTAGVCA